MTTHARIPSGNPSPGVQSVTLGAPGAALSLRKVLADSRDTIGDVLAIVETVFDSMEAHADLSSRALVLGLACEKLRTLRGTLWDGLAIVDNGRDGDGC